MTIDEAAEAIEAERDRGGEPEDVSGHRPEMPAAMATVADVAPRPDRISASDMIPSDGSGGKTVSANMRIAIPA